MHRALFVLSVALISCAGGNKPAATPEPPPPSAKQVATPEATCTRVAEISKMKPGEEDRKECVEKMHAMKDADPALYKCIADCVEVSHDDSEGDVCLKQCLPEEKRAAMNPDAEGYRNLGSLEIGSKNMFQQETDTSATGGGPYVHTFCPPSKQPVPATLPPADEKVKVENSEWNTPTWTCLKFSMNEPQYFQYSYETNGKEGPDSQYVAVARRRLPNGKVRTIRLTGRGDQSGDAVRLSITTRDE